MQREVRMKQSLLRDERAQRARRADERRSSAKAN
jgi:hypothetical protein